MERPVRTGRGPAVSRRAALVGGAAALLAARSPAAAQGRGPDRLIWGVNGHPMTAYNDIDALTQLDLVRELGFTGYRFNTRGNGNPVEIEALMPRAAERGITLLPVIGPDVSLADDPPERIRDAAYRLGRDMAARFKGRIPVWELANEAENFAIIQPCETRDDGSQYPCEWGPAGGVTAAEYHPGRWRKVSALLAGLSQGVHEGDPAARRAIGTAGWGHLGAFERLKRDGVAWDITVWHDYPGIPEEYLKTLAGYGKPIWITEFNVAGVDHPDPGVSAIGAAQRVAYYREIAPLYGIEAAFFYELLDETYWGDTLEAKMGLYRIARNAEGRWRVDGIKPVGTAIAAAIRRGRPDAAPPARGGRN